MQIAPNESNYSLSEADQVELAKLVSVLELSSGTTTIFAVALESGPQHPVVEQLKSFLSASEEDFKFQNFFYSDNSLHNFLYSLDDEVDQLSDRICSPQPALESRAIEGEERRLVVMAFGIDQLPTPRLVREMKQLNLGRESLFGRELVLIFWLNKLEFLEEFRNRAPDFWDWRGKVVRFETRPVFNPLFYPYLEWLIAENSYLKISGVMQVQRQVDIFLDQIYVSLQAERRHQVTETLDRGQRELEMVISRPDRTPRLTIGSSSPHDLDEPCYYEPIVLNSVPVSTSTKTVTQKVDLSQAVRENQYSVILGAPGAGKTTLLRYLALHFATAKRDTQEMVFGGEAQEELGKALLPIFFRIADYAERLNQQPDLSLLDYLRQFYRQWEVNFKDETEAGTEVAALLLEQMRHGQCLMLLDGLDEVFDQESRRLIVERINQFVEAYCANKFVVTSRIAGYRDVKLSDRFAEFTIEDMGSEQVEQFLERWCQAIEQAQQPDASEEQWQRAGDAQTREILEAIKTNEGVKRLTANPLLLTILALIHRSGDRLPNRRVKLYDLAVQTLTEDWQLRKKLPDAPKVILKESEVVELLAPLAYWMHDEKPSGVVTQAEVEEQLAVTLAELNDADPESDVVQQAVEQFLRKVRETTGLFVERAPGVYGFMHLTFEEYFAARYIADNEVSDILQIIRKHLHEPRWNEPILLALGYFSSHSPKQVNKLVEQLFRGLEDYNPAIGHGEIQIKNVSSSNPILVWSVLDDDSAVSYRESASILKDLMFAGQVLAEVEVNSRIRSRLIRKLVFTYLGSGGDTGNETIKKLLRLLRQIEAFNQKCEVVDCLQEAANDSTLPDFMCICAQSEILYIACGEPGTVLVDCVTKIFNKLNPSLFESIKNLMADFGEEITPALESTQQNCTGDEDFQQALAFMNALSYIRTDHYAKAIKTLGELAAQTNENCTTFINWALAICYQEKKEYDKAIGYYHQVTEKLASYTEKAGWIRFWRNWGVCYRLHTKYQQSIECFQQALAIAKEINESQEEANELWNIGRSYQDWGKYEQAIAHHQQSRDLYEQLGREENIANQWYWLSDCYREWGKYEQAVECEQHELALRQKLDDQPEIALAYWRLGRIYQTWSKYEQASAYYQQSRELYELLGKEQDVATLWYWVADCYRDWGKYEQAIECQQQCLTIRQTLDDQSSIASAYYLLGSIYQDWGKYEQAIAHYQQSRDLYEQLGQQKDVANQWYWLGDCYRDWGKYKQAAECQQQCLTQRQKLENQSGVASAYNQLGRIYQAWGKYEEAIAHYQQSRELYEQLSLEKDVPWQWYWLANCYRDWGKYEQALECQQQCLKQIQKLEDQSNIALAYNQLGRIYQAWGKYEEAIAHYQQSRDLYEQLGREQNVANQWYWLAACYRNWGKYEQAVECEHKDLAIRQKLDDEPNIADAYNQLGRIYQAWGKYEEAIAHYQQSRDLYEQLGREQNVANQWDWLAYCYFHWSKYEQAVECQRQYLLLCQKLDNQPGIANAYFWLGCIYRDWNKHEQAVEYYQQSFDLYEHLGIDQDVARCVRQISSSQRHLAKNKSDRAEAFDLLAQAEQNIRQAIQLDTAGEDKENLAYDYSALGLLWSERLRLWPFDSSPLQEQIAQFEEYYNIGLAYFAELGQTVDRAEEALDMARTYLEVNVIENLDRAEELAHESLQVFQDYNRRKLEAAAHKLLGEIYLSRAQRNQPSAETTAHQFLAESLKIYRELDLNEKATEVEQLMHPNAANSEHK